MMTDNQTSQSIFLVGPLECKADVCHAHLLAVAGESARKNRYDCVLEKWRNSSLSNLVCINELGIDEFTCRLNERKSGRSDP